MPKSKKFTQNAQGYYLDFTPQQNASVTNKASNTRILLQILLMKNLTRGVNSGVNYTRNEWSKLHSNKKITF